MCLTSKNNPWDLIKWSTPLLINGWFLLRGSGISSRRRSNVLCVWVILYGLWARVWYVCIWQPIWWLDKCIHSCIYLSLPSLSHKLMRCVPSFASLELKPLFDTLKYIFLGSNQSFLMIIANYLNLAWENQVLNLLWKNKEASRWTFGDIGGIIPNIVQHRILLKDNVKPYYVRKRRLKLTLKEVVKKEIHK